MKRHSLPFFLIVILLPALACHVPTSAIPASTALFFERTPVSTFTMAPTRTFAVPTATSAPPTTTPTITPTSPPGFSEPFDAPLERWEDVFVLTTQASGGRIQSTFNVSNGMLTLTLVDRETYLYRFYRAAQPANVFVELEVSIEGQKENTAALICRADEGRTAWYEARVSGNGDYTIYRYSKARKTELDLNPFLELVSGKASATAFTPGAMNVVRLICQGTRISLDFNRGTQRIDVEDDAISTGGAVGFGVMAYANPPATFQFDEVNAGLP